MGWGWILLTLTMMALIDVLTLDMLPVSNVRQKLMFAFRNIKSFYKGLSYGYTPQFVRNNLQLNQNKFSDGRLQIQ